MYDRRKSRKFLVRYLLCKIFVIKLGVENKNDMNAHGYLVSGLLFGFIRFIEKNAKYPIKFLMRDAGPMLFTANKLKKCGISKLESYEEVYLTRNVVGLYTREKPCEEHLQKKQWLISKYLEQHGINENHTQVDTGVLGTIPKALYGQNKKRKIQSLYFSSGRDIKYDGNGEKPWFCGMSDAFLRYSTGGASRWDINTYAAPILECSPKKCDVAVADFRLNENGKVVFEPKLFQGEKINDYKNYYQGIDDGLNDIIKRGTELDEKSLKALFQIIYKLYKESGITWKIENTKSNLLNIKHDDLYKARDSIEQIYCGK